MPSAPVQRTPLAHCLPVCLYVSLLDCAIEHASRIIKKKKKKKKKGSPKRNL